MREILFKAKRIGDGKWIEGDLIKRVHYDEVTYYIGFIEMTSLSKAQVIPETVGQYTGLTDKNGNRVFEGDIVKLRRRRDYGIVKYAIPECHFEYLMQGDGDQLLFDDVDYVEIIGNIHDNADLLGGENNAKEQ